MGRYTGPKTKICRRVGFQIFENQNVAKSFLKRESVRFQGKQSDYGRRLTEKQKIMHYYGLREKQMLKFFDWARRAKGDAGRNFLILCERRLDNVVCQAGLAPTRAAARQLISHGHVRVNDGKVDVPSYLVKTGDTITLKDKPGIMKLVDGYIEQRSGYDAPDWIAVDLKGKVAKIVREPMREDVRLPVDEQMVVEFYSK